MCYLLLKQLSQLHMVTNFKITPPPPSFTIIYVQNCSNVINNLNKYNRFIRCNIHKHLWSLFTLRELIDWINYCGINFVNLASICKIKSQIKFFYNSICKKVTTTRTNISFLYSSWKFLFKTSHFLKIDSHKCIETIHL